MSCITCSAVPPSSRVRACPGDRLTWALKPRVEQCRCGEGWPFRGFPSHRDRRADWMLLRPIGVGAVVLGVKSCEFYEDTPPLVKKEYDTTPYFDGPACGG
jgi:hypothetical protein